MTLDLAASGEWVRRGSVLVLEPTTPTIEQPSKVNVHDLIACLICRARVDESCRTRTGRPAGPHAGRLAPRLCPCGSSLGPLRKLCDPCRDETHRANQRDYARRVRAERKEAA